MTHRKMIVKSIFLIFMVCAVFFIGCAPTTNCYTARTLDKGEKAMTPGLDYIAFMDEKGEIEFNKMFVPSLGMVFGLPYRLEAGLRGYFPYTLESAFRWQVNPKSFTYFTFIHFSEHIIKKGGNIYAFR